MLWRVYVQFSNQTCFIMCIGCQASTKTHNYGHYFCLFLNAGFQNLGKLNTGFDVLPIPNTRLVNENKMFKSVFDSLSHMNIVISKSIQDEEHVRIQYEDRS